MLKKSFIYLLLIAVLLGACGCMRQSDSMKKIGAIDLYLSNKYQQTFTYVSKGNDVWSSKAESVVYADQNGNRFAVKDLDGYFSDNYCASLFDEMIGKTLCDSISIPCKAVASTTSAFFDAEMRFLNADDYMSHCPVVNLSIYVLADGAGPAIANDLLAAKKGLTASVLVCCVTQTAFDSIRNGAEEVIPSEILSSASFWLENDTISAETWGHSA